MIIDAKQLPQSWHDLTVSQFQSLLRLDLALEIGGDVSVIDVLDNYAVIAATLLRVPYETIRTLRIDQVMELRTPLLFLGTKCAPVSTPRAKCKEIDAVTYDDYVRITQMKNLAIDNLAEVADIMAQSKSDVNEWSVPEFLGFIDDVKKKCKRSRMRLLKTRGKKMLALGLNELFGKKRRKNTP